MLVAVPLGIVGFVAYKVNRNSQAWPLLLLSLGAAPVTLILFSGFSREIGGLLGGIALLVIFSILARLEGRNRNWILLVGVTLAGFIAYWSGFRIQFARFAFAQRYFYFHWLSLPLTLGWLVVMSRSVEFYFKELGPHRWKLFLVTILLITVCFIILVNIQGTNDLTQSLKLGLTLIGSCLGLLLFTDRKIVSSSLPLQIGFLLSALAISGVVKSFTAFVLVAPIASLALPITGHSMAFVKELRKQEGEATVVEWLGYVVGSRSLATVIIYSFLSYVGLSAAWYVWEPGPTPLYVLTSSLGLLPLLILLAAAVSSRLDSPRRITGNLREVNLFGVRFSKDGLAKTVEKIRDLSGTLPTTYVATPDVTAVVRAQTNRTLKKAYYEADVVTPDGFGLVWAAKTMGLNLRERVAGIDILHELFSSGLDCSFYFLGSKPGVARRAAQRIEKEYKGIQVVGTYNGYFEQEEKIIREINEKAPDVLLVGMGVPLQEEWILNNKHRLSVNVVMGIGGSLDVLSGRLPRAPRWLQDMGLEWLYRIRLEPYRMWRARLIPVFMKNVWWERIKQSIRNEIF